LSSNGKFFYWRKTSRRESGAISRIFACRAVKPGDWRKTSRPDSGAISRIFACRAVKPGDWRKTSRRESGAILRIFACRAVKPGDWRQVARIQEQYCKAGRVLQVRSEGSVLEYSTRAANAARRAPAKQDCSVKAKKMEPIIGIDEEGEARRRAGAKRRQPTTK